MTIKKLTVKMHEDDHEAAAAVARSAGVSLSTMVRDLLTMAVESGVYNDDASGRIKPNHLTTDVVLQETIATTRRLQQPLADAEDLIKQATAAAEALLEAMSANETN